MLSDDTLREGLQAPGLSFTYEEKIELAKMISSSGISRALISYPSAHISEFNVTRDIVNMKLFSEVYALGRTVPGDIDTIYESGANISLHVPFNDFDVNEIIEVIKYARSKGRNVELAIVDIAKYDVDRLISLAKQFSKAGVNVLQIPDTTGRASPERVYEVVSKLKKEVESEIEIHCHNDAGLSVANAIAGISAGCDYVDTTLMGIGERNGITDSLTIANYLVEKGLEPGIRLERLEKAYDYMINLLLKKVGYSFFTNNIPIYGRNVRAITAGTHSTSSSFPNSYISINVYVGSGIIKEILRRNNVNIDDRKVKIVLNKIKDLAVNEGRTIDPMEVVKIYGEII